jgi:hypothetical protein
MRQSGRWPARDYTPGERVPITWRVTPEIKQWLDAEAEASGRSLSARIEIMLQRAADAGHGPVGPETADLLRFFAYLVRARFGDNDDWFEDPDAFFRTVADLYEVMVGPKAPNFDDERRMRTLGEIWNELPETKRLLARINIAAVRAVVDAVKNMADDDPRLLLPISELFKLFPAPNSADPPPAPERPKK